VSSACFGILKVGYIFSIAVTRKNHYTRPKSPIRDKPQGHVWQHQSRQKHTNSFSGN
jgi:hypothetical protein